MKYVICILLISGLTTFTFAQIYAPAPFLEKRVLQSDLIFEGKIINVISIDDKVNRDIRNTNCILVSKWFKGDLNSDTIRIFTISDEPGTTIEDVGLSLGQEQEGIFFCVPISKIYTKYADNNIWQLDGDYGFVPVDANSNSSQLQDHNYKVAIAKKIEKIERTLYDSIEQFAGQKYVKLRLNSLEQNLESGNQKKN